MAFIVHNYLFCKACVFSFHLKLSALSSLSYVCTISIHLVLCSTAMSSSFMVFSKFVVPRSSILTVEFAWYFWKLHMRISKESCGSRDIEERKDGHTSRDVASVYSPMKLQREPLYTTQRNVQASARSLQYGRHRPNLWWQKFADREFHWHSLSWRDRPASKTWDWG